MLMMMFACLTIVFVFHSAPNGHFPLLAWALSKYGQYGQWIWAIDYGLWAMGWQMQNESERVTVLRAIKN